MRIAVITTPPKLKRGHTWRLELQRKEREKREREWKAELDEAMLKSRMRLFCKDHEPVIREFARAYFTPEELAEIDARHAKMKAELEPPPSIWKSIFGR